MNRNEARVLLLEPHPKTRVALHHTLRALGCRVIEEAGDAIEAIDALVSAPHAVLFTAWRPKGLPGPELLAHIRHDPRLETLPVVIADQVTPELVLEAAEAGVSAFLPLPADLRSLDRMLDLFVGHRASGALFCSPVRAYRS